MSDTDARGAWTLHLDILVEVMAISQLEATALMATCRLLYQLGPPYVLRHGVTLRTRSQMMSFVSFMLADAGRLAHLRSLDLGAKVFEPLPGVEAHATDVSYILAHPAIALHTLILHDMEKLLACSPHLLAAIGALSTLKRLYVHGVGRAAIVALRTMRSQLVSATMALMGPLGYYPALRGHSAFSDVFSVLQLSAHTLQELDLSLGTPVNTARDIPVSCQFPHVHTFRTVLDTHFPQCTLLRLFPNLQNFHIVPGMGSFDFTEDPNAVWFMVALRDANSKIGLSPSLKLLECSGEITSLYPLTAHLTVSRLRVRGYVGMHELPFFRVVLAEAQPAELELDVHGLELVKELAGILRELEPRTMRALTLNVSFRPGGDGEQLVAERSSHAALDTLLQTMSNLKVRVNVASRRPLVLPPGAGPPTAENPLPDFHPAPAPSSKISGANLTDAQRLDWHIAPQEA